MSVHRDVWLTFSLTTCGGAAISMLSVTTWTMLAAVLDLTKRCLRLGGEAKQEVMQGLRCYLELQEDVDGKGKITAHGLLLHLCCSIMLRRSPKVTLPLSSCQSSM